MWRGLILPLNTVALVVLLIWLLQSGRFPGLSGGDSNTFVPTGDFFSTTGEPLGAERGSGPGLRKPAPEFALLDTQGEVVHLTDFRGKVVLLNFWATWCPPCRKEFPELVKTYAGGSSDVVVIGVDLQENADEVREFAREFGADFPIVIDSTAEVADAYRLLGLPSTYFIDQQGILREQHFGELKREIIDDKIAKTRDAGMAAVP